MPKDRARYKAACCHLQNANSWIRCFGDKGDVEDITEGSHPLAKTISPVPRFRSS
jgi:hypothetical protein